MNLNYSVMTVVRNRDVDEISNRLDVRMRSVWPFGLHPASYQQREQRAWVYSWVSVARLTKLRVVSQSRKSGCMMLHAVCCLPVRTIGGRWSQSLLARIVGTT